MGFASRSCLIRSRIASEVASSRSGRNSCSGGSSRRIVTGSPAIASKIPSKSACWIGSSRSSAARRSSSLPAMIISRTTGSRSSALNMCSVRQRPIPWAPSSRALAASSGVSAFARTFSRRSTSAHSSTVWKSSLICGGTSRDGPEDHRAGRPVDRDLVALVELVAVQAREARLDLEGLAARHARDPLTARDHRGVGGEPAVRGQDPRRVAHAVVVVRRRLPADEDHALPRRAAPLGGGRVEDDLPRGRPRRGVQTGSDDVVVGVRVEHRVEQLLELARFDPRDRLLAGDQALVDHVHRGLERGRGRPLRRAGLEQVQRPLLDRELDVLHVAVVLLEPPVVSWSCVERLRQQLAHPRDRLGRPDPGDDVLALGVDEELAEEARPRRSRGCA